MDRQLTYEKLKAAALAIRRGAKFISSNPDPAYPDGQELIPASGAIQAALEAATGIRARVTGKPELPGFQMAITRLGSAPAQTGMLGDQLETDILGAKKAGLKGFLILSSLTPCFLPDKAPVQPDAVFESTSDFYSQWTKR
jgi:4-nitrophenyl phosphatase